MKLLDYLDRYGRDREITSDYEYQLTYAIKRFSTYLGRPAEMADLNRDTVNSWLKDEHKREEIGPRSRNNIRRSVMTLWSEATDSEDVPVPHRIRPVKVPDTIPNAWTFEQVKMVAEAASDLPGSLSNGVPRSLYFPTVIWFSFETGLRRRDMLNFDVTQLRADRGSVVQNKTGKLHVYGLTDDTARDILRISNMLKIRGDSRWATPLRLPGCLNTLYFWLKKARVLAGIEDGSRNRSVQHLRRSGATQVEIESPGSAPQYLGHTSGPALARKCYVDQRLTGKIVTPERNRACPKQTRKKIE